MIHPESARTLLFVTALSALGAAAACQTDTNEEDTSTGGGRPLLPVVTSVGPGAGSSVGGSMGGAPGTGGQPMGGNPATGGTPGTGGNPGTGGQGGDGGSSACSGSAPMAGDFVINELHTSPSNMADDANCDGSASTGDEFIEVVNATGGALDLAGVELRENDTLRHTFSECLPAGQAIVVYRSGTTSMCMAADWGTTIGVSADTNYTLVNGGGETITLELGATTLDTATTVNLSSTNPRTSMVRDPDVTGAFVFHTTADTVDNSPISVGTCIDGTFFPCN